MSKWKRNIDEPFKPTPVTNLVELEPERRMEVQDDLARQLAADVLTNLAIRIDTIGGSHDDFIMVLSVLQRNMTIAGMASLYERKKLTKGHALAMEYVGEIIKAEARSYSNKPKTKA
jgi:enamine deaminase RidA (YjgF/YER057c/UK114 family)